MKNFQKCIYVIAIVCLSIDTHAQLNDCNTFLKNNYLEVGVNWNGAFGSSVTPPAGYHPDTLSSFYNCGGTKTALSALGFVADVDKDGWSTGTPNYYGDYILPGAHQEGWSLMANGTQINEWNNVADDSSLLEGGTLLKDTAYSTGPTGDTSIWEGYYDDAITIFQMTVLDTSHLFFTVYVQVVNSGTSASENVYYMRTIKSENDALLPGGGYTTKNKIESALPDALSRTIVSSSSTLYPKAYVALATRNPVASAFIIKTAAAPVYNTIDNIFAGTDADYDYAAGDSLTNGGGIGIIFSLGSVPATLEPDTFSFVYAFTPGALSQALGLAVDTATHDSSSAVTTVHAPADMYSLYPNPSKNTFTIRGLAAADQLYLFDELGRNVSESLSAAGKNSFTTGDLPSGLYVVLVKDRNGNVKWKTPFQKL